MLKKSLLLMLLMAFMAPWAVNAQTRASFYTKVTANQDDWSGNYLLVNTSASRAATNVFSSGQLTTTEVTIGEGDVINDKLSSAVFQIEKKRRQLLCY